VSITSAASNSVSLDHALFVKSTATKVVSPPKPVVVTVAPSPPIVALDPTPPVDTQQSGPRTAGARRSAEKDRGKRRKQSPSS
jgi:hypothetical protein